MSVTVSQLCHIWAQGQNDSRRSGNVFYEKSTIYSYGYHFPMAVILDSKTVLINNSSYSVSTSRQQAYVRNAISHYTNEIYLPTRLVIKISDFIRYNYSAKNIKKHLKVAIEEYLPKVFLDAAINAGKRKKATLRIEDLNSATYQFNQCTALLNFFKVKMPAKIIKLHNKMLTNYVEISAEYLKIKKREAVKKLKAENERLEKLEKEAAVIAIAWRNPTIDISYNEKNIIYCSKVIRLRVKDDTIQTSKGAEFPLDHGKKAFKHIVDCVTNQKPFYKNGKTIPLGNFGIDEITPTGDVKAGCHFVQYAEIERIAKQLELI